jgi:polyhydroxyalkanoate synthesis regulator phasin
MSEKLNTSSTDAEAMLARSKKSAKERTDSTRYKTWSGVKDINMGATTPTQEVSQASFEEYLEQRPGSEADIKPSSDFDGSDREYEPATDIDREISYLQELFSESDETGHRKSALELLDDFVDKHNLSRSQERALRNYLLSQEVVEKEGGYAFKVGQRVNVMSQTKELEPDWVVVGYDYSDGRSNIIVRNPNAKADDITKSVKEIPETLLNEWQGNSGTTISHDTERTIGDNFKVGQVVIVKSKSSKIESGWVATGYMLYDDGKRYVVVSKPAESGAKDTPIRFIPESTLIEWQSLKPDKPEQSEATAEIAKYAVGQRFERNKPLTKDQEGEWEITRVFENNGHVFYELRKLELHPDGIQMITGGIPQNRFEENWQAVDEEKKEDLIEFDSGDTVKVKLDSGRVDGGWRVSNTENSPQRGKMVTVIKEGAAGEVLQMVVSHKELSDWQSLEVANVYKTIEKGEPAEVNGPKGLLQRVRGRLHQEYSDLIEDFKLLTAGPEGLLLDDLERQKKYRVVAAVGALAVGLGVLVTNKYGLPWIESGNSTIPSGRPMASHSVDGMPSGAPVPVGGEGARHTNEFLGHIKGYNYPWDWAHDHWGNGAGDALHRLGSIANSDGHNVKWHGSGENAWISVDGKSNAQYVIKVLGKYAPGLKI